MDDEKKDGEVMVPSNGEKVRFSSVQAPVLLNFELNLSFGSGCTFEIWTKRRTQGPS